jgi:Tat protein translocase TatB subunit
MDINLGEYLIIFVVALLVFGPERLPEITRKAGSWVRDMRIVANNFKSSLESEVAEVTGPMEDLKREVEGLSDDFKLEASKLTEETERALEWSGPTHSSGPTHADSMEDLEGIDRHIGELEAMDPVEPPEEQPRD